MDIRVILGMCVMVSVLIVVGWLVSVPFRAWKAMKSGRGKKQKDEVIARLDRIEKKLNEVLVCFGEVDDE